jgi:hypothetical protein
MSAPRPVYDGESDVMAWAVGSGIVLIQACAIFPGLLPVLLLLLPLVLPLVVLGLVAAILIGPPLLIWRLVRRLFGGRDGGEGGAETYAQKRDATPTRVRATESVAARLTHST